MNGAVVKTVKMDTRRLRGLVDREALRYQHSGHNTTKTAATAAVSAKGRHLGTLVIADRQNDEAPKEMARSKKGSILEARYAVRQLRSFLVTQQTSGILANSRVGLLPGYPLFGPHLLRWRKERGIVHGGGCNINMIWTPVTHVGERSATDSAERAAHVGRRWIRERSPREKQKIVSLERQPRHRWCCSRPPASLAVTNDGI